MIAVEQAVRAWVNGKTNTLVGDGNPLSGGAYLLQQRSPATGAYAVISRTVPSVQDMVAEDDNPTRARVLALVYHPDQVLAEGAAVALAGAWNDLNGAPEPCGATGIRVLVTDNLAGPVNIPTPADSGEPYCYQVSADWVLTS